MKHFRIISLFFALICAEQAYCAHNVPLIASTIIKTTFDTIEAAQDLSDVPADIKAILDTHCQELQIFWHGVWATGRVSNFDWLPGYYVKHGIERYTNSKKLKLFIEHNHISLIVAPEKFLYHMPGKPYALSNDNYLVIAKKAPGSHAGWESLNSEQRTELKMVSEKLPHHDLHNYNFVVAKNGIITIIDTDDGAMPLSAEEKISLGIWSPLGFA